MFAGIGIVGISGSGIMLRSGGRVDRVYYFPIFRFPFSGFGRRTLQYPGRDAASCQLSFMLHFWSVGFPLRLSSLCPLIYLENYSSSPARDSARMEKDLIGRERKITFLHYSKLWTNVIHILKKRKDEEID